MWPHYTGPCYRLKYDTLYALNNDLFICYTHMHIVCAVVPLTAVTEVVLVISSDKKELKEKYSRNWLMVRLRDKQRPRATWRDNCKA